MNENLRTLRVALVDDELVARRRMQRLLEAVPGVEVVGVHEGAASLLEQLEEDAIDVLLLDVQMPGLTGTEVHALLGDEAPYVIFATAHPQHAVEAFALGAVDYVLKPIEAARLSTAIDRARVHLERGERGSPRVATAGADRVPVATHAGIVLLDPEAISHAVFDGSLVSIHTTDGRTHLADGTLQDLQARLPDSRFDRVHRRVLLNLFEVDLLRPTPSGGFVACTRSGQEVPVSRQSARRLRKTFGLGRA